MERQELVERRASSPGHHTLDERNARDSIVRARGRNFSPVPESYTKWSAGRPRPATLLNCGVVNADRETGYD